MREIRTSGSEGGGLMPPYPYQTTAHRPRRKQHALYLRPDPQGQGALRPEAPLALGFFLALAGFARTCFSASRRVFMTFAADRPARSSAAISFIAGSTCRKKAFRPRHR